MTSAGHQHHERIEVELDRLPALADMLREPVRPAGFEAAFEASYAFILGTLVPHMETIEQEVYPELERLMQNRHSMAPMRREHAELTRLVSSLDIYREALAADALGPSGSMGLRRVLYRLYALLKVHLAEEEEYLRVLDHNLSAAEQEVLAQRIVHAGSQPL
jgi:iron-sulfur cluster repair protein YtfE (RIC family)